MKAETVYFQITLAAPLHVGCGEVYEPVGFVVDEDKRELVSFAPSDFLARLSSDELEKYSAICRLGTVASVQQVYKFMRLHQRLATGRRVAISNGFYKHYKEVLEKPENRFQKEVTDFAIHRTAFNPLDNEPVIPGSAIKGAIRTAVLNFRNKGRKFPRFTGNNGNRKLQEHLLGGSFDHDPFSLLKVSDFVPVGEVRRTIKYAVSFSKKTGEKKLHQMQEMIEPGSSFWGSITIMPGTSAISREKALSPKEIIDALRKFYGDEKRREDMELGKINATPAGFAPEQAIPLRLGKHSGAECMTVNGHRRIKISPPGKRARFSDPDGGATTIWLASDSRNPRNPAGLSAMGWVRFLPLGEAEQQDLYRQRQQMQSQRNELLVRERKEQEKLREIQRQKAREAEENRLLQEKLAAEAEAARKEEERQWQQMSEVEQYVAIVQGSDIARAQVPEKDALRDVWPKLDSLEAREQKEVARAFYASWSSQEKLWRKKQCSESQWKKVERLVEILDESHPDIRKVPPAEQAVIDSMADLRSWGDFRLSGLIIEELSLPAAEILEQKFREWGCTNKKAKKDKQKAWKLLRSHLHGLRKKQE